MSAFVASSFNNKITVRMTDTTVEGPGRHRNRDVLAESATRRDDVFDETYKEKEGVTAGAHRLWSHRSYKASLPLRIFLATANSMAFQTDADPHNAIRGFFFSHIGWLLVRKHPDVIEKGKKLELSDLKADKVVMFQRKYVCQHIMEDMSVLLSSPQVLQHVMEDMSVLLSSPQVLQHVMEDMSVLLSSPQVFQHVMEDMSVLLSSPQVLQHVMEDMSVLLSSPQVCQHVMEDMSVLLSSPQVCQHVMEDMSVLLSSPQVCQHVMEDMYYKMSVLLMCFAVPMFVPWCLWGESLWLGYFVPGLLRYTLVLNATWLVNSAAHMWGNRPYDANINPRENKFVTLSAIGEGFHNYHHTFPYDYATSEFGCKLNLTTCFIDLMCFLGLAKDCKRVSPEIVLARAQRTGDGSTRNRSG
ncbi:unnamed protein product [Coregonus sp. 'balchen']|nr:unnamed protein product [Coregonus sp. 'balchen']